MERLVRGARHDFVEDLLAGVVERLSDDVRVRLDASLADPMASTGFLSLKLDAGAASPECILSACDRLDCVERPDLPYDLLTGIDPAWVRRLSCRVDGGEPEHATGSSEPANAAEMRRHSDVRRLGVFALYLMERRGMIIDGLVDLLLEIVHRLQTRSRRRAIGAVGAIAKDIERAHGKERLLVDIAMAAADAPEGRVMDVIYPVAGAEKLKAVVEEHRSKGTLDRRIQTVMRGFDASSADTPISASTPSAGVLARPAEPATPAKWTGSMIRPRRPALRRWQATSTPAWVTRTVSAVTSTRTRSPIKRHGTE